MQQGLSLSHSCRAASFECFPVGEVAFLVEVIMQTGMNRGELLQRLHATKSFHRSLSSSELQVSILGPVVEVPAHLPPLLVAQFPHRGGLGAKAVRDDLLCLPMTLQSLLEECQSRKFVPLLRR